MYSSYPVSRPMMEICMGGPLMQVPRLANQGDELGLECRSKATQPCNEGAGCSYIHLEVCAVFHIFIREWGGGNHTER